VKRPRLKAPFPWFGGKSRVADLVWDRFGDVPNYVEPFFGSGAVMLARPTDARTETINDIDCFVANFWRAVQANPALVALWADWPVNEADLHARHLWLVTREEFQARMKADPEYYDPKVAGWWVWGISCWIGSGWCSRPEWKGRINGARAERGINSQDARRPSLTENGVHTRQKRPRLSGWAESGVHAAPWPGGKAHNSDPDTEGRRPHLGRDQGVTRNPRLSGQQIWEKRPELKRGGRGAVKHQLPDLGGDSGATGRGVHASARSGLEDWMFALADRLRRVRVCCGDWKRILGRSPTECIGITGVFLDPPYSADRDSVYSSDSREVAHDVREWAIENGANPSLRIALCGYTGEHAMPADWSVMAWKANGGHANASNSRGRANAVKERIWFSPHCLQPKEPELFERV
jgi:hypothetical protein